MRKLHVFEIDFEYTGDTCPIKALSIRVGVADPERVEEAGRKCLREMIGNDDHYFVDEVRYHGTHDVPDDMPEGMPGDQSKESFLANLMDRMNVLMLSGKQDPSALYRFLSSSPTFAQADAWLAERGF